MRNVWMIVSSVAVVVAIGGTVYYFFPKQAAGPATSASNVPQLRSDGGRMLAVPAGNPLLSAHKAQFIQWYPPYCGADMYLQAQPSPHKVDVCVNGIVSRVATATGVKLTRTDVLDPRVKTHWREIMGAN